MLALKYSTMKSIEEQTIFTRRFQSGARVLYVVVVMKKAISEKLHKGQNKM